MKKITITTKSEMSAEFEAALPVLRAIEAVGCEAYFVGGSVRDHLIGRTINDVDIASEATPDEIKAIFKKTIDTGIQHGTVVVRHEGLNYEVTTFRKEEEYLDFRRPSKVSFTRHLHYDLERRDFTINALAMDSGGNIIDLVDGISDLNAGVIRAIGDPKERFNEDALRMLRAIRFQCQLGFKIESNTFETIKLKSENLKHISQERITSEFEKMLMSENAEIGMKSLVDSNLYEYMPFLSKEIANTSFENLDTIYEKWAKICLILQINPRKILQAWKSSKVKAEKVNDIVDCYQTVSKDGWNSLTLFIYGPETSVAVAKLLNHDIDVIGQYDALAIKSVSELCVNGNDLMNICNRPAGAWLKETFNSLVDEVVQGHIANTQEDVIAFVTKNKPVL